MSTSSQGIRKPRLATITALVIVSLAIAVSLNQRLSANQVLFSLQTPPKHAAAIGAQLAEKSEPLPSCLDGHQPDLALAPRTTILVVDFDSQSLPSPTCLQEYRNHLNKQVDAARQEVTDTGDDPYQDINQALYETQAGVSTPSLVMPITR